MPNDETPIPIACSLGAHELLMRRQDISHAVLNAAQRVEELADGYAFQFAYDENRIAKLVEFISAERKCCPFFTFELVFEPGQGPLWLRLRGPEGTKQFIKDGLGAPPQPV